MYVVFHQVFAIEVELNWGLLVKDSRNWVNGASPLLLCPNIQHYPSPCNWVGKKATTEESRKMTRGKEGAACISQDVLCLRSLKGYAEGKPLNVKKKTRHKAQSCLVVRPTAVV